VHRLENLFNFNLIKTSQNKGYKFYVKNSYTGNYIDVSDTLLTASCVAFVYGTLK